MSNFTQAVDTLRQPQWQGALTQLTRGIEREALRIDSNCHLAQDPHNPALGSALTHPWITTDFSESLLEMITPVYQEPDQLLQHLSDAHTFVLKNIGEQRLWPLSMPCFLGEDDGAIPIAQYGTSHIGRMKTTYRIGLHNRYGSQMQAISGLHFNFSLPSALWPALGIASDDQAAITDRYFSLLRYFRRKAWVLAYLFGASPSLCKSFLGDTKSSLPFVESHGTVYLPYATSLRMSDLGYTNSAQDALSVSLNGLEDYVRDLKHAISVPSAEYAEIGVKVDGEYRQLNSNVLQIENELYASMRPKRTADSGETPSDALARGGIEYVEVRALDINPFAAVGIDRSQVLLLDLFLLDGLLLPTEPLTEASDAESAANFEDVVLDGRRPDKTLQYRGEPRALSDWMSELFERWAQLAPILDAANGDNRYSDALQQWQGCATDPTQTLSAKVLDISLREGHGHWAGKLADKHRETLLNRDFQRLTAQQLEQAVVDSHAQQAAIEAADSGSFDQFLVDYFAQ
ncbi:glutamate--cysteine ligase [Ferrimonas lipolytica]|uniref:Glutamate--cysteine ligase n=1 Tax=Ferrimonas lipolytica TaxID=2724191 RepID=A0A6H1UAB7_9GAMM|nr:glutamate--cysteine ligase [Ferrimonas lipolytica]QIZ75579.1 glutamate--cysteine ligase [Ferrimonas lipolytica]